MKVFLFFVLTFVIAQAIVCPKDACKYVKCKDTDGCREGNGIIKEKGGVCGCCDICVTILNEGDLCEPVEFGLVPPEAICSEGLQCDHHTFTCKKISEISDY
ncbi:fungal protease inhibitor-1-like [Centruroides sculpturatus]|uniref:fungal protease inhibitor-1-like n=1 Tax=Centruroides sculpturatus TaxID=218467 RepID=UPI000C6D072D|nr:fungal protease inhibitor-1-like [Centruroides sculpturatus]